MFDKLIFTPTYPNPQPLKIDVHEHRASTDASLQLLTEMQEKAQQAIINKIDAPNNNMTFKIIIISDMVNLKNICTSIYSINGHRREVRTVIDKAAFYETNPYNKIVQDITKDIIFFFLSTTSLQEMEDLLKNTMYQK